MPMAGSRWTSSMTTSMRRWCTRQTPRKWSYKQQGDIIIANNPHAAVKPLAASAWMLRTHASGNPPYAAVIRHAANGEERVLAGGKLSHHAPKRTTFRATAATRWTFAFHRPSIAGTSCRCGLKIIDSR